MRYRFFYMGMKASVTRNLQFWLAVSSQRLATEAREDPLRKLYLQKLNKPASLWTFWEQLSKHGFLQRLPPRTGLLLLRVFESCFGCFSSTFFNNIFWDHPGKGKHMFAKPCFAGNVWRWQKCLGRYHCIGGCWFIFCASKWDSSWRGSQVVSSCPWQQRGLELSCA